nr:outer membrane beta-barrel protein [Phenylobacterium aquaticum]
MAGAAAVLFAGAFHPALAADGNASISLDDQATAQSNFARDRNVSVTARPRPDYQAAGIRTGSFLLFPKLTTTVESNDNIFAQKSTTTSDTVWHVQPDVTLSSDWNRHALSLFARGSLNRYSKHDSENTDDYSLGANGRIDVARDSAINGGVSYGRYTEPRTSPDSATGANEATRYDLTSGNISAFKEFNRLKLTGRFGADKYNYDDVASKTGKIDQDYRDRVESAISGRADYAVSPDTALFIEVIGNRRDYRLDKPAVSLTRDSEGVNVFGGANFELSALLRGEIGLGYMKQDYKDSTVKDVDGFGARAQVEWFPSELTTVTVVGSRSIKDSAALKVASYIANTASIRVDHELLRNVLLSANIGTGKDEYQGSTREDKVTSAGLRGTYLVNRNVGLTAGYAYEKRTTSGLVADRGAAYEVNKVSAGLTLQF